MPRDPPNHLGWDVNPVGRGTFHHLDLLPTFVNIPDMVDVRTFNIDVFEHLEDKEDILDSWWPIVDLNPRSGPPDD